MRRKNEKLIGLCVLAIGGAVALGVIFGGEGSLSKWEVALSGGLIIVGLWFAAPVGTGGLIDKARNSLPFLEDADGK